MTAHQWYGRRNNRTLRYAGRVLDPTQDILIRPSTAYASRYDGQVATIVASNLLSRMSPAVALDIPDVEIVKPLPWAGEPLRDFIIHQQFAADPHGRFSIRSQNPGDYVLTLGSCEAPAIVHGSGWNAYIGPSPSPVVEVNDHNPVGPAMAAIIEVSRIFIHGFTPSTQPSLFNALTWETSPVTPSVTSWLEPELGNIWTIGAGSVGTAVLYFLSLATRRFETVLFDMDSVALHNLDRSPIFVADDVGEYKVAAASRFLTDAGAKRVDTQPHSLHESPRWKARQQGTPDLFIATANELNVRHIIENGFPPIQIYGTTGRQWQACVLRHIPFVDACSCCLFPSTAHVPTECAAGEFEAAKDEKRIDAALPFLSFAAGAMAAAEILKLQLPGFPFSSNRTILHTRPSIRLTNIPVSPRTNCICSTRSDAVHRTVLTGSRYQKLSLPVPTQEVKNAIET